MNRARLSRYLLTALAWCTVALFAAQAVAAFPQFELAAATYADHPAWSNSDKLHAKWGAYYDLMNFIQRETPSDAVILMDNTAREQIDLYFLYPRKPVYGDEAFFRAHPEIGYVVVTSYFPNFEVHGQVVMMDDHSGLYRVQR